MTIRNYSHCSEWIDQAEKLLQAERLSAEVVQRHVNEALLNQRPGSSLHKLDVSIDVYAAYNRVENMSVLMLWTGEELRQSLSMFENHFPGSEVWYEITDNAGISVLDKESRNDKPFWETPLGTVFPAWNISLYLEGDDIFKKAAQKQITLYTWAGVLVVVLILITGGLAGQAVSKQVKLNTLKNDFIATVSHELKTPLASMRVLADTLLQGNYRDPQQVTDYLQLICKENKRLTGLIDNFLTFSRMERNKLALTLCATNPAVIARDAAEAIKTKFNKSACRFEVAIPDDLPYVMADHDSMVTVLVNLLDNAYKYSGDDKHIELRVFSQDGHICFRVRDNGKGVSRRLTKKIFQRFYQVDRSLSRHTEGCGLGLSIAKFIVDAHNGTVSVDSKPGQGSIFTVMLMAAK